MFRYGRKSIAATACILWCAGAFSMDGFSVSCHSTRFESIYTAGDLGEIWRHNITNNAVESRTRLYGGPARQPVISPDGEWVAFLCGDDSLGIVPSRGGQIRKLVKAAKYGHIDWVDGWIYYNQGTYFTPGSARLRRVSPVSGKDEGVVTFECGIWRFHISRDGTRCVLRPKDNCPSANRVFRYDMTRGNGLLPLTNSTEGTAGSPPNRCQESISPSGALMTHGEYDHKKLYVLDWTTFNKVPGGEVSYRRLTNYGPDVGVGTGVGENGSLTVWSVNSEDWFSIALYNNMQDGINQVLVNWRDSLKITVTRNGNGSFDCSGDLWVAGTSTGRIQKPIAVVPEVVPVHSPRLLSSERTNRLRVLVQSGVMVFDLQGRLKSHRLASGHREDRWYEEAVSPR